MYRGQRVALIIPALNEEQALPGVLAAVDRELVERIVVADNGSTDATASVARAAGAEVVHEPRRGYGSACLKAIAAVPEADLLVFVDADGSDDPRGLQALLDGMHTAGADLVVGSRVLGRLEPGALTPVQRFGNWLTCSLLRLLWGVHYTDLGPFRAVRREAYERLRMADPDFGWTVEMQVKAAQQGLRGVEVPVDYRRRQAGRSKVSGSLVGSYKAGRRILGYVASAKLSELAGRLRSRGSKSP